MTLRRRWDINTRTQLITLGPALLLTLLLISFFTFVRIQDLRQELDHTGQLIANQLAPATEYGVISGNNDVLESLLRATLATPHVRFLEIQDSSENILVYVEQPSEKHDRSLSVKVFQAPIRLQHIQLGNDFFQDNLNESKAPRADYLGRVIVGMSNDAFSQRQQEILFKAGHPGAVRPAVYLPARPAPGRQPVATDQCHGPCGQGDPARRLQDAAADCR